MRLRDYILENFWLKLFSLVLAVMIWYVIDSNMRNPARAEDKPNPFKPSLIENYRRPVTVMTSASNRRLLVVEPSEVSVRLRGDPERLANLASPEVKVYVNLSDIPEPNGSFRLEVDVPSGITVMQVLPSSVFVRCLTNQPSITEENL